ncbi:MAG: MarR family winged helix-turn-helix transcriptional regulator [Hyphomicrobiaceae bacterium]|nr:MarR family winged helix-turn-helix transcriptional regulator [Hyphomicrobiaceae bacterium]
MAGDGYTTSGKALTDLILETFRLNGRLLLAGDRLVASVGLSSARWQVMGAIHFAHAPQPVSWLARSMGLNRQGVQRIVNELEAEGFVEFRPNPHHRRAHLVLLTRKGEAAYAAAQRLQTPWVNALAKGLRAEEIKAVLGVLETLRARLEQDLAAGLRDDEP